MARHRKVPEDTQYFKYYNANPKDRWTGDCVIRAIATVTQQTWRKVLDDLVDITYETGWSPTSRKCYEIYLTRLGFVKMKQPRKSNNKRYTGREFISYMATHHPTQQRIFASIGSHHVTTFADLDGDGMKCVDIWDVTDNCVGNYFVRKG